MVENSKNLQIGEVLEKPYFSKPYGDYSEVHLCHESPFDSEKWVETIYDKMLLLKELDPLREDMRTRKKVDNHLLPIISLMDEFLHKEQKVRILDFGGGMGDNFCQLTYWYPKEIRNNIEYYIVDSPRNCKEGKKLELIGNLTFIENQTDEYIRQLGTRGFDIIILCGTLQYLHPYRRVLGDLVRYHPKYIYITRTMVTNEQNTLYLKQLICPGIGKWEGCFLGDAVITLINLQELHNCLQDLNYDLALDLFLGKQAEENFVCYTEVGKPEYYNLIYKNEYK